MGKSSRQAAADERARPGAWGRSDALLFGLAPATLALIAVQFALAGFGAFTMDKTPTDNVYGAHVVLGLVIAVLTLLILATVLASRTARAHPRTMWPAVTLTVLAVPVQSVLGEVGKNFPAAGALHALNAVIIFTLAGWLTLSTSRRRAASQPTWTPAPVRDKRDASPRADRR